MIRSKFLMPVLGLAMLACGHARAQILIGQTAGFSGAVAAGVKEVSDGAKLYLDAVNARGGVNGQTIQVLAMDDKFEPKLAADNARELITQKNVLALFLTRGTPHTQAVMPLLTEHKVPLIAPSTGAMALHSPVHPWLFNVRATYQREADRAVRHLSLVGMTRIGIVQVDDSFGADAIKGALKTFESLAKQPAFIEKFDRSKPDFSAIVPKVLAADAQAVLFIGAGQAVADGVAALRRAGSRAQIVTLSNNASAGFIKLLGEHGRGTIVTQVSPYERSISAAIIREARELARARGAEDITPAMVEGFTAAKVLVEGLKRAGPNPTRDKLRTALETFKRVDLGGLEVSFSASDHSGVDFVDLSIIGEDGKFRR
jgi:ABC-type branched-subunit amino acid transport system substrate-binding protein